MSSPEVFCLFERDKKFERIPYHTNKGTYVGTAISLCRGTLQTPAVQDGFNKLAQGIFNLSEPDNSFRDTFMEKILQRFPVVVVDNSISSPVQIAAHVGRPWGDKWEDFDPGNQAIMMNGPRVRDMCSAGEAAEECKNQDSVAAKRYRTFLFLFSLKFLHELAHVFVTYLTFGAANTPPDIDSTDKPGNKPRPYTQENPKTDGEAGRYLEELILGGTIAVMCNPLEGEEQSGIICMNTSTGRHPVSQDTIDEFLSYKFKFPISHAKSRISSSLVTLGGDIPNEFDPGDPLAAPNIFQLLAGSEVDGKPAKNLPREKFTEHQETILWRAPFDPSLRLEAAK